MHVFLLYILRRPINGFLIRRIPIWNIKHATRSIRDLWSMKIKVVSSVLFLSINISICCLFRLSNPVRPTLYELLWIIDPIIGQTNLRKEEENAHSHHFLRPKWGEKAQSESKKKKATQNKRIINEVSPNFLFSAFLLFDSI